MPLSWVSPAWDGEGFVLSFERGGRGGQQLLALNSDQTDPGRAAEDMAKRLLATAPADWDQRFGYSRQREVRR